MRASRSAVSVSLRYALSSRKSRMSSFPNGARTASTPRPSTIRKTWKPVISRAPGCHACSIADIVGDGRPGNVDDAVECVEDRRVEVGGLHPEHLGNLRRRPRHPAQVGEAQPEARFGEGSLEASLGG